MGADAWVDYGNYPKLESLIERRKKYLPEMLRELFLYRHPPGWDILIWEYLEYLNVPKDRMLLSFLSMHHLIIHQSKIIN